MIKTIFNFLKISFTLNLKKMIAFPASFWLTFFTIPFYSLVQIVFVESIYGQTTDFAGYSKYEAYILFGTFRIVQGLGFLVFYNRLSELRALIRGDGEETFDMVLTKPIDAQLYSTVGGFNLGNLSSFAVGAFIVFFGVTKAGLHLNVLNIAAYLGLMMLGVFLMYVTFLLLSTLVFWFDNLEGTEGLWDAFQTYGQYPSALYHGTVGVIFNFVVPITLMAGLPVEILLGKIPLYMFLIYTFIIASLFLLSRAFWNFAIKKYSSFSS